MAMSIYQFHKGEWRHIGAEIVENSLQARTNSLGQFIVLSGNHGELDKGLVLPEQYTLYQNYPNPFNPVTTIQFDLAEPSEADLSVYNILGEKVRTVVDRYLNAGSYDFIVHAGDLPSGMYLYRLTAKSKDGRVLYDRSQKLLLIK